MVISVSLQEESYNIYIERGALARAGELLHLARRVLVVTDSGVPAAYAAAVADACELAQICTLPAGESSKSFESYQLLLRAMLRLGMTRGDCVAAVGGGMAGDLAGFAAATYMRGVDFYNIPTTLLSQVDSSIGGKTAIDMDGVKNIVGAFHQPPAVLIDPDTLRTLPPRQISAGLAESVKMTLTSDADLLDRIERSADLTAGLPEIIARSLTIKKNVVERVALGMLPMCAPALRPRLIRVLRKCGLPTEIETTREALLPYLRHDKKGQGAAVTAVEVDEPGSFRFTTMMPEEILHRLEGVLL